MDIRKIPDVQKKADWWFDFLEFGDERDVLYKDLSLGCPGLRCKSVDPVPRSTRGGSALGFMNPLYAVASVLLFLPGWLLIKSISVKWERQDQPGF
jgi:hypothetical protein